MKLMPEEYYRKNINTKEIKSGEVQKERALGVAWIIKIDTFGFKISLKISQQQREVCYPN